MSHVSSGFATTYGDYRAELANDNDTATCAKSGFETAPFLVVDMGTTHSVNGVHITGNDYINSHSLR